MMYHRGLKESPARRTKRLETASMENELKEQPSQSVIPPQYVILPDPWEPQTQSIPLDGGLERQKFAPLLTVLFALVLALLLFHFLIGPLATFGILMLQGVSPMDLLNSLDTVIAENARSLLVANTIGQIFALAIPFLIIAGWHTRKRWAFLRFREPDWTIVALSVFGLVGLTPISWWLGNLNASIPFPEWVQTLEESQLELIEQVLEQNLGIVFSLAVMAVTPAICEEILFRGYLQRQFERSIGVVAAILVVGLIFGIFHLRFTQFIPLSVIGMYLAYLTWRSGSIWPAIIIHFANNAFAVCLGLYISTREDISMESLERMDVPGPALLLAVMILGVVIFMMENIARQHVSAATEETNLT